MLARRFAQAAPEELPPGQAPEALARYVFALSFGLAVQAAGGTPAAELHEVADLALSQWPPTTQPNNNRLAAINDNHTNK